MEWISVKEKNPDKEGDYLILRAGIIQIDFYLKRLGANCWSNSYQLTHWMPLPDLPKD